VLRPDGSEKIADDRSAPIADALEMARDMAQTLLKQAGPGFFDWR
jgi:hydroxymethylbilane synthase